MEQIYKSQYTGAHIDAAIGNMSNVVSKDAVVQSTGTSTTNIMSQNAITTELNDLENSQTELSTTLANLMSDFYAERNKLVDLTGEFYGENMIINPHFDVNQRIITLNQSSATFMADRWYKNCTNEVRVSFQSLGTCELYLLKTLTTPLRAVEQRIE